jgi:phage-related tail fiber protein
MPNTILLKRGTTAKNDVYTGQSGEITVDTDVKNVRVHDGTTPGGTALAKATHVHAIADVSNLTVSLAGKADAIHSHSDATTGVSGFLSASDKSKIDGIAVNANNYVHPTTDGSLHVPATGTGNNLKVLKAGATAGSITWGDVAFAEVASKPTTLAGYGIADAAPLASPALTGTPTAPTATAGTNTTQLATTAFVQAATDAARQGLSVKDATRVATTANLTASYASQILTNTGTLAALVLDGVTLALNDRVLVKDQTTASQNGIYIVTAVGSGAVAWTLTRATDANLSSELPTGTFAFVSEGTTNADAGFVLTTNAPITLDTTALAWTQFSGAGQITAGTGLTKTGNSIDVGTASTGRIVVNPDNIDLATTGIAGGTYRSLTIDTYGRATAGTNPTTLAGYGITDAAPLASPALTGTPTAPTATVATNTTQLATTAFVQSAVGQITAGTGLTKTGNSIDVGTASTGRIVVNPDNIDLATTGIAGGTYRSLTIDTYGRATAGTNPTTLAGYGITDAAPLASPALTGTPTAPTATVETNTTQLATTAFVQAAISVIDGGVM